MLSDRRQIKSRYVAPYADILPTFINNLAGNKHLSPKFIQLIDKLRDGSGFEVRLGVNIDTKALKEMWFYSDLIFYKPPRR